MPANLWLPLCLSSNTRRLSTVIIVPAAIDNLVLRARRLPLLRRRLVRSSTAFLHPIPPPLPCRLPPARGLRECRCTPVTVALMASLLQAMRLVVLAAKAGAVQRHEPVRGNGKRPRCMYGWCRVREDQQQWQTRMRCCASDRYICCNGDCPCSGRFGEQSCPEFCLGLEVTYAVGVRRLCNACVLGHAQASDKARDTREHRPDCPRPTHSGADARLSAGRRACRCCCASPSRWRRRGGCFRTRCTSPTPRCVVFLCRPLSAGLWNLDVSLRVAPCGIAHA